MTTLTNFPHKLLVLQTALRMNRLAINEELSGAGEKDLVAALICFLDSADYTRPITAHRVKIANFADLAKTSFFKILGNLRKKGIIEPMDDSKALRFTPRGAALLTEKSESQAATSKGGLPEGFFRVGRFTLPRLSLPLLDRGLRPVQIATLMREAKLAGTNLQHRLKEFGTLITRYTGDSLFLVFRSFLKDPVKYQPRTPAHDEQETLTQSQRLVLHRIADGSLPLLATGETLRTTDHTFMLSRPAIRGGAPHQIAKADLVLFEQRAQQACQKAGADIPIQNAVQTDWFEQFARLAPEARVITENSTRHPAEGRSFERGGMQYKVERVDGHRVTLLQLDPARGVRIAYKMLSDLKCPQIRWQEDTRGSRGEQY